MSVARKQFRGLHGRRKVRTCFASIEFELNRWQSRTSQLEKARKVLRRKVQTCFAPNYNLN
jgi:hypothetical protein